MLRSVRFKRHRSLTPKDINFAELGLELADLTKYCLCLWQLWDYTPEEALSYCDAKSELVEQKFLSDFSVPKPDQPVLVTDLDNTLCDFNGHLLAYLRGQGLLPGNGSYSGESSGWLGLGYEQFRKYKDEFDAIGLHESIPAFDDAWRFLDKARAAGWYVEVHTARPGEHSQQIALQTWRWFGEHRIHPDRLVFGEARRVLAAYSYATHGRRVLYLEDRPDYALEAARLGIRTVVRRQPYNVHLEDVLDHYPTLGLAETFDPSVLEEPWQPSRS